MYAKLKKGDEFNYKGDGNTIFKVKSIYPKKRIIKIEALVFIPFKEDIVIRKKSQKSTTTSKKSGHNYHKKQGSHKNRK